MTQDEIIEMWHTANGTKIKGEQYEVVEAFAKLVARHEREACAQVAQDESDWNGDVAHIADLIRARGQA
jgi:copper oxidase (laccase) domain-containing protein